MDAIDRRIVNELQDGFPLVPHPFAEAAERLGVSEQELTERLKRLLDEGTLSRFGPLYNAEAMGGALTLVAMQVPAERFDEVAALVNSFPEVAHNYARDHAFNMWFVVAAESRQRKDEVLADIRARTGLVPLDLPKRQEFFLGLRFEA